MTDFYKSISKPLNSPTLRVISLGAGVQSSVMALMADCGEIGPKPDCAIFADTGWEPAAVYEHLTWLESQLSFPVYRVSAGNIREDTIQGVNSTGQRFASMPFFLEGQGMGRRQCTKEYKLEPITKKIRELCGLKPKQHARNIQVEQWIGFSVDEAQRMKDNQHKWITNRWPLLEEYMSRRGCEHWFNSRFPARPLVKSACVACSYHSNTEWRALTKAEFEDACEFDDAIRNHPKMDKKQFVHRDCIPLREVDLSTPEEAGQISFLDECDGICGV